MEIIDTDPNAATNQRLREIELSKEYSLAKKNNPELFGSMTYDQYKSSLYERVTSLEGDDRYNYINKWLKDVQQAAHTRGRNVEEFRSMYDEYVAERYRRTTPTTLDEGDEFYVKNALKDYVEHKGKPDEQAFYDRYLERVRRYNELNSVDGKIPTAPYTAPYNATGPTKPAHIPGIENAPVHYARASGNNRETSDQYGGKAPNNPDYKTTQKESYIKSDGSFDYESQKAQLDKLGGIVGAYDKDWYAKYKAYRATKGPIAQELGITRQNQIDWLTANYTDIINGSTGEMEDMPTIIPSQGGDRTIYAPTIKMPSLQVKKTSRSTAQKKTEAAKRVVNVDMLDYSAYTGRSEYISRALLGRKAALMYMSRKSTETAGMPVTDISRR